MQLPADRSLANFHRSIFKFEASNALLEAAMPTTRNPLFRRFDFTAWQASARHVRLTAGDRPVQKPLIPSSLPESSVYLKAPAGLAGHFREFQQKHIACRIATHSDADTFNQKMQSCPEI